MLQTPTTWFETCLPFSIVITFTTAESKLDYYQQKLNVRVDF